MPILYELSEFTKSSIHWNLGGGGELPLTFTKVKAGQMGAANLGFSEYKIWIIQHPSTDFPLLVRVPVDGALPHAIIEVIV